MFFCFFSLFTTVQRNAPLKMFYQAAKENCIALFWVKRLFNPIPFFTFGCCLVSFVQRDSHTSLAVPLWPQLMQCLVEDKWKRWWLRDSRRSWPSDRVAESQSLMHPFFLSKWFLSLCFFFFFARSREQMRGSHKGYLEDSHICADGSDVGKEQNWIQ